MEQIPGTRDQKPGLAQGIQPQLFGLCFSHPAGLTGLVSTLDTHHAIGQDYDLMDSLGWGGV
jgi:hypothetical protein